MKKMDNTTSEMSLNGATTKDVKRDQNINFNASEIDEDTERKLRGDAIGNTLYSESFVIKTLLQLSDLNWTEQYEEDLCFLWDMTLEQDVCKYLFNVSFPNIACTAICKYNDINRFVEIAIGIIANMFCSECEKTISNSEIKIILNEITSDDHLILIQVVRFIKAVSYCVDMKEFITKDVITQLCFILKNSLNNDLLTNTLDAASKIMLDQKIDESVVTGDIVTSSLIAYKVLLKNVTGKSVLNVENEDLRTTFNYLLEIVVNCLSYVDKVGEDLLQEIKNHSSDLLLMFNRLLSYYTEEANLNPIPSEFAFHINALTYVIPLLYNTYLKDTFRSLLKIATKVYKNEDCETDSLYEIICFFISVGEIGSIEDTIKSINSKEEYEVLKIIYEANECYDFNYRDKLQQIIK